MGVVSVGGCGSVSGVVQSVVYLVGRPIREVKVLCEKK